ncbi:serine hydrolase [Aliiroseovarius subalbicans]|uniref:serine hydrolase domain-containing protein n=1 Tax=Aliiroseovarius subalbicans TaxID=2925840 RepID=UPI001F569D85|nr:serine hydrolase [Aliiroseovarius subalbicans]MCI2400301.1 beta-lactamase family protein [Aliiroseovarius subalbicans]
MRRRVTRLALILAVALTSGAVWKREELTRLNAVTSLFSEQRIVENFIGMDGLFLTRALSRGDGPVSPLPNGSPMALPDEAADWIRARMVLGLVVMKDGAVRHESYHHGTDDQDLRISWSVAKSWLSALMGVVVAEGAIASLDDPVTRYAPTLTDTAYDGATIRNVLNMSSGVTFDEDYLDFWSDINRMGRVLALGRSMDRFAEGLDKTFVTPGAQWQYVSIDTHVIGMVIRGATGRDVPTLLEEKILRPMGLEAAPYYLTDGHGVAFVLGGLNMRTRDNARFGQMFLQDGRWNGRQIVPADWVRASTTPSAPTTPGEVQYGYQWWMPADAGEGEYYGIGIYGQFVYVNRPLSVVIAMNSADRHFKDPGVTAGNIAMFRKIAEAAQ